MGGAFVSRHHGLLLVRGFQRGDERARLVVFSVCFCGFLGWEGLRVLLAIVAGLVDDFLYALLKYLIERLRNLLLALIESRRILLLGEKVLPARFFAEGLHIFQLTLQALDLVSVALVESLQVENNFLFDFGHLEPRTENIFHEQFELDHISFIVDLLLLPEGGLIVILTLLDELPDLSLQLRVVVRIQLCNQRLNLVRHIFYVFESLDVGHVRIQNLRGLLPLVHSGLDPVDAVVVLVDQTIK